EIEGERGRWVSLWLLRFVRPLDSLELDVWASELEHVDRVLSAEFLVRAEDLVTLRLTTTVHPLEVESYVTIDAVLGLVDERSGGLKEVNDSPRDWWRTFRNL